MTAPAGGLATRFRLGYRPELDGLRAVAVAAVMGFHFVVPWLQGGFLGVDVFFVLSGFLITSLLIEEQARWGRIRLGAFYVRRVLRLYPALVLLLAVCTAWALLAQSGEARQATLVAVGVTLFYAMNWYLAIVAPPPGGVVDHAWSLAIEEQFYLLWPVTVILLFKLRRGLVPLLVFAVAWVVGAPVLRWLLLDGPDTFSRVYNGLDTRADALLAGCLLAAVLAWRGLPDGPRARTVWRVVGAAGAVGLAVLFVRADFQAAWLYQWGLSLTTACSVAVVLGLLGRPAGALRWFLRLGVVVYLGQISYGLYLWHWPVRLWLRPDEWGWPLWAGVALWSGLSLALASASYALVERRFLRLKDRFVLTAGGRAAAHGTHEAPEAGDGAEALEHAGGADRDLPGHHPGETDRGDAAEPTAHPDADAEAGAVLAPGRDQAEVAGSAATPEPERS